jgi:hypothetical protein
MNCTKLQLNDMLRMLIDGKGIYASTEEVMKAGTHYKQFFD